MYSYSFENLLKTLSKSVSQLVTPMALPNSLLPNEMLLKLYILVLRADKRSKKSLAQSRQEIQEESNSLLATTLAALCAIFLQLSPGG